MVALALGETVVVSTRPLPIPAEPVPHDASTAALTAGTGAVLDLPLAGPTCPNGVAHYLLQSAVSSRPVPLLLTNPRAGYAALPGLVGTLARIWADPACPAHLGPALRRWHLGGLVLHAHDHDCPVPAGMAACLEGTLGPGTVGAGVTWWDPLP